MSNTGLIAVKPFEGFEQEVYEALNMVTSGVGTPEQWLVDALGGGTQSDSGAYVNFDSTLSIPVAKHSVDIIAGHIASMPKEIRRRLSGGGSELMENHPAYRVCNFRCNDTQSCFNMWHTLMSHALLLGNGRAFIRRDGNGMVTGLQPLMPNTTYTISINGNKYHVTYFTQDMYNNVLSPSLAAELSEWESTNSLTGGSGYQYTIPDEHVLHIYGVGYNGLWGYPLTMFAKNTLGVDLSGLEAVSYQFNNGGRPGLLITAPKGMLSTEKEATEFMRRFSQFHSGTKNAGRTGLLRDGMTAHTIEASAADGGLKDLREYSREDVSILFGTQYLFGSSSVYKDRTERYTAYVLNTLNNWMEPIEQQMMLKMLSMREIQRGTRAHLDASALLRGSPSSVAEYTGALRAQGLVSGNEAREMHGLNPVPELQSDYGNPNVQSGEPEPETGETGEQTEETEENSEPDARLVKSVRMSFASLIDHEKRRVSGFASRKTVTAANFGDDVSDFYEKFERKLRTLCAELEIDPELATQHVAASRAEIRAVAGTCQDDQLKAIIPEAIANWDTRAEEFLKCLT